MKIHEYQAKEILKKYNIPIQDGIVVYSVEKIEKTVDSVATQFNTSQFVIKAQIHAGGRGLGGGVKFSPNKDLAISNSKAILGMNLKTHQTGPDGQHVKKVMITEALDISKAFYVAITLDRSMGKNVFMVSKEGGMEIEEVAASNPDAIKKVWVEPGYGLKSYQAR